ncbi:MAG TPA: GspH/FimT family pseudopilin [Steroidobacteraceae bacterium]|nr:GspH/FimT family pseudopilin [Gammaproteobacteria bacterium]HEV2287082.1 GspH/FimT family pseudopilin [Steroidobacteraceae bacterium]
MKRQTGFTLTELMVVIAIVAILLGIGVPSYRYVTNSYRMSAELNSLVGDLMYARAEAIKEGQPVAICASTDGLTCSGATSWQGGWIVFPDPAGNGAADAPASVLHVQQAFTGTDTLTSPNNPVSSVLFNREGFAAGNGAGAAFAATQYDLQDKTANIAWTRCISISAQGMIQIESATAPTANFPGACP